MTCLGCKRNVDALDEYAIVNQEGMLVLTRCPDCMEIALAIFKGWHGAWRN